MSSLHEDPLPLLSRSRPGSIARPMAILLLRMVAASAACAGIALEHGFYEPVAATYLIQVVQFALVGLVLGDRLSRGIRGRPLVSDDSAGPLSWGMALLWAAGGIGAWAGGEAWMWRLVEGVAAMLFVSQAWSLNVLLSRRLKKPGILFPMSFLTLIVVGTLLLKMPRATPVDAPIGWLDALFTMTSAVCVTGLVVRNTATEFTPLGQGIICVFIQLGGLGIIFFGSALAMLLGRSMSVRENVSLSQSLNDQPLDRLTRFARFILLVTVAIELAGAAVMYTMWEDPEGTLTPLARAGMSVFHSVSAFCNAGFDITGDSLTPYRSSLLTHGVILPLIVLGGLGFPVLENLWEVARLRTGDAAGRLLRRLRGFGEPTPQIDVARRRLRLHTKLVLVTTAALYVYGFLMIGLGQLAPYLREHAYRDTDPTSVGQVLADASFMSVSARTAGFNSLPMEEIQPTGRTALMTLMVVGGSPGSTAGGVKTTVLALLVLSVIATMRQRESTEAFRRRISDALVRKAATIALCYLGLIVVGVLLLSMTESQSFENVLFEVISAATTTGLSLGITAQLTTAGKCVIIAVMFLGRVGPLALLVSLVFRSDSGSRYSYPREEVVLG